MNMNTLYGLNIQVSALIGPVPVLQVSPAFKHCSDKFRSDHNQCLLDLFGTKEVAYRAGNTLYVSPGHMVKLREAYNKGRYYLHA